MTSMKAMIGKLRYFPRRPPSQETLLSLGKIWMLQLNPWDICNIHIVLAHMTQKGPMGGSYRSTGKLTMSTVQETLMFRHLNPTCNVRKSYIP